MFWSRPLRMLFKSLKESLSSQVTRYSTWDSDSRSRCFLFKNVCWKKKGVTIKTVKKTNACDFFKESIKLLFISETTLEINQILVDLIDCLVFSCNALVAGLWFSKAVFSHIWALEWVTCTQSEFHTLHTVW